MSSFLEKFAKVIITISILLNLLFGLLLYINQSGKFTIIEYGDGIMLLNTQSGETFLSDSEGKWELSQGFDIKKLALKEKEIISVDTLYVDSASVSDTIDFKGAIVK